ncbi:MAG: hypothetical protein OEM91_16380 [Hyphomicrobiales bacterium]|nr:hypothetical protein [Hyphomicrobiales bacterium]
MKAILRSGFLALAIMALAVPAYAGPFEDGLAAYQRGHYATALKFWQPLAEQGDARAQKSLGVMYAEGSGVSIDDAEAAKWHQLANAQIFSESRNIDWISEDSTASVQVFSSIASSQGPESSDHFVAFYDSFCGDIGPYECVYADFRCNGPGNFSAQVLDFDNEELARLLTANKADANLSTINHHFLLAADSMQLSALSGLWNIGFIGGYTDEIWYTLLEAPAIEITVGTRKIHIALNAADKANLATVAEACLGSLRH